MSRAASARPSRTLSLILVAVGLFAIIIARLELWLPDSHASIANHHLQHLYFVLGGALWGIALGRSRGPVRSEDPSRRDVWLIPAVLAPVVVMFLMWPGSYPYIETRPFLHFIDHLVFIALAAITTYGAYRYARQLGWVFAVTLSAMAWLAVYGYGVTPGPNPLVAAVAAEAAAAAPALDAVTAQGQLVYDQNCAGCHQPQGTGLAGVFPPLVGHVPELLEVEGGRDYLMHVVVFGVQGPITVAGQSYAGLMPSWSQLSDEDLAAVLHYVAGAWGNEVPADQGTFTAAEIASVRLETMSAEVVHGMREALALP